ncbi:MAG: hypothetical protein ABIP03_15830 [Aquihabitans sp.]
MTEIAMAEPGRLQRWITAATSTDEFWSSSPSWKSGVARAELGSELVMWSDAGLFNVERVAGVVAQFLDGEVTLATLAEDLAATAEVPLEHARALVASLAVELTALHALVGTELPELPAAEPVAPASGEMSGLGETTAVDPESGEEIRVVTEVSPDGNVVITEYLPDGRRRVSTTMTFATGPDAAGLAAAEALAGDRSVAELVPCDSCLGSKLRNHDDVPLVSVRGADHKVRSVRCHDAAVAERLRALAGERLATSGERGPVEAFVVTPLEGSGPLRIFDGRGQRRGRPRSVEEAATVVDQILGEKAAVSSFASRQTDTPDAVAIDVAEAREPQASGAPTGPVPLGLALLGSGDGRAWLVPLELLDGWGLASRLKRAGLSPTWGRAVLGANGQISAPSAVSSPAVSVLTAEVLVEGAAGLSPAERLQLLFGDDALLGDPHVNRAELLARVAALAETLRWSSLEQPLAVHLGVDRPADA